MINVIWYKAARGNWDSGLLCSVFDAHPDLFHQLNTNELIQTDKAIVIVVGRPEIPPLQEWLNTIKSGLVILTSEEDSEFDWKAAVPDHLEVWTQYYSPNKQEIKERILLGAPNRMKDYLLNIKQERKYLWSFIGQVQNPFRQACVEALKKMPDGFLHIAGAFGGQENGIAYHNYLDICCQSKFVMCPAGSMCVDSFRVYEAIECGAIPIVDIRAPRDPEGFNYWQEVWPAANLIFIKNWNELNGAINMLQGMDTTGCNTWWKAYKKQLADKLIAIAQ